MSKEIPQPSDLQAVPPPASEQQPLINFSDVMGHKQPPSIAQQMQDGVMESVSDTSGQIRRGVEAGALGYWLGRTSEFGPFKKVVTPVIVAAAAVTAIDHYIFQKKHDEYVKDHHEGPVESLTKFGVDLLSATGAGLLMSRLGWANGGKSHIDYIDRKFDSRYVPAHRGGRGPKRFNVRAHYQKTPVGLGRKLEDLEDFLKGRDELGDFDSIADRITASHEKMWKK